MALGWLVSFIHMLVSVNNNLYIFFRRDATFDYLYFTIVSLTIISWNVTGKECILSYYEKKLDNPQYVYDSAPTSHPILEQMSFGNKNIASIITLLLCTLLFYNLLIMLRIYETNYFIIGMIFSIIFYNLISARVHVLNDKLDAMFS